MLSIDEAIEDFKTMANDARGEIIHGDDLEPQEKYYNSQIESYIEEKEQLAEWLEELKEMRKNQGQIADFWYQEGISRESKLIFDKIEEIKNRYNVEDFAIIGVLIKVQEIVLEIAEQLKDRTEK